MAVTLLDHVSALKERKMAKRFLKICLISFLIFQFSCSTKSCELINFKNHTLNFEKYMKLREKVVKNEPTPEMTSDCLSEILYCIQMHYDKNFANRLNILLLKQEKIFWARLFEIVAKDIDERNSLLQNIKPSDIPSDEDHIKVIFSLCNLEEIPQIKDSIAKAKLMPFYNEYLKIIDEAKQNVFKTCPNCPKDFSDFLYCDHVSSRLELLYYYENSYLFTKENEKGYILGIGNYSQQQFKSHILEASLNSWHHRDTEKYRQEIKEKLKSMNYMERGNISVETSFLAVTVFLGKKINFNSSITEYTIEEIKFPVPEKHKLVIKELKEFYERQLKIKAQDSELEEVKKYIKYCFLNIILYLNHSPLFAKIISSPMRL